MTFLGRLDKWTRKLENVRQAIVEAILGKREEDKTVTGRRALHTRLVRFYGIQEMADELKASKKSFFQTKGGSRYAIATRTVTEKGFLGYSRDQRSSDEFRSCGFRFAASQSAQTPKAYSTFPAAASDRVCCC